MGTSIFLLCLSCGVFGVFLERSWTEDRWRLPTTVGLICSIIAIFISGALVHHYLGAI